MAVECWEHWDSRRVFRGHDPAAELRYFVHGTDDETEALEAVANTSPTLFDPFGGGLFFIARRTFDVEPVGPQLWESRVIYGPVPVTGEASETFEIGGGLSRFTQSIRTVARYAPIGSPLAAPNFRGAINVTSDGTVQGVDIGDEGDNFTVVRYVADYDLTPAYKSTVRSLRRRVNNAAFRNHAAGEVLFLGMGGGRRGQGDWELAYHFSVSLNRTGLQVPETNPIFPPIDKAGWHYLWLYYADAPDAASSRVIPQPAAAYVEQVFHEGDFSLLGLT